MKLTVYNKQNSRVETIGLRCVSVRRNGKCITLSRLLCRQENVRSDIPMYALVAFDEDSKNDWYLTFGGDEDGFKINEKNPKHTRRGKTIYFCCGQMASKILDAAKCQSSATFLVSEKPQTVDGMVWYKILISKALRSK